MASKMQLPSWATLLTLLATQVVAKPQLTHKCNGVGVTNAVVSAVSSRLRAYTSL